MTANVLVLETYADVYARYLREMFPDLGVHPVSRISDLKFDLGAIDVLVAFGMAVNDDLIRSMPQLKWIQSLATGVDHFLRCPSLKSEVLLTSARGIHGPAMRETVAYLMLSLSHETPRIVRNQREHRWDRSKPWTLLCGKSAVVVGVGLSGTAIAQLLKTFGMRVVGVSRTPRQVEGFDNIVTPDRLTDAAAEADYLINILPGDAHNHGAIGRAVFAAMKPTAFFVNVGRGETVDEEALIEALRTGKIAGAGLDVFRTEPLPPGSPLWDMPNVFLMSHIGGLFTEYEEYVMPILGENMRLFLAGRTGEMRNLVAH
jgi:D-2-hydroxyacid dehydrogenase (NADP+)